jgi:hypothetical protein
MKRAASLKVSSQKVYKSEGSESGVKGEESFFDFRL